MSHVNITKICVLKKTSNIYTPKKKKNEEEDI
jgi:hypothetical protein